MTPKVGKSLARRRGGWTRREFLQTAGAAAGVAALTRGFVRPARAGASAAATGRSVAVFGGGIAGMTVAHELAERGFAVSVYESRAWGGKARSTTVPGTGVHGRRDLPGEHAFRVPFGCYQNLPDTMKRIPFGSNPNGVFDNLVPVPGALIARRELHDFLLPTGLPTAQPEEPQQVLDTIVALLIDMELPPPAAAYFATRMGVYFSSCDARRDGELEKIAWNDFIRAERYASGYEEFLGQFPRFAQASKPHDTNAKYCAWVLGIWIIYGLLGRGTNGPVIRVLNAPTNEAWIDPWVAELTRLGAVLNLGYELAALDFDGSRITGVTVIGPDAAATVAADWYVSALPVERARSLWTPAMLEADPQLAGMSRLGTAWMNGIGFYVNEPTRIAGGLVECADSPWAVTFIPQAQFWKHDFAATYGDGRVMDKISAAIADWNTPGVIYGKPAIECTPDEVATECWTQIKQHVNNRGRPPALCDDMLVSWNIDPGMTLEDGHLVSHDPLILPTKDTQQYRPDIETAIPNLLLCGDYIRGPWEVANMEAPCFNGRKVANAILDRTGSGEARASVRPPFQPPEWEPLRRIDEERFRSGESNLFATATDPVFSVRGVTS
jgi:uncharacterized protein with NAD-binding domain and iron-sulfur cluster